jgi:hypothetical protein
LIFIDKQAIAYKKKVYFHDILKCFAGGQDDHYAKDGTKIV